MINHCNVAGEIMQIELLCSQLLVPSFKQKRRFGLSQQNLLTLYNKVRLFLVSKFLALLLLRPYKEKKRVKKAYAVGYLREKIMPPPQSV